MLVSFFVQTVYEIHLKEHSNRSDVLLRVLATDRDEGDYGVVRYSSSDTNFMIDALTVSCALMVGKIAM